MFVFVARRRRSRRRFRCSTRRRPPSASLQRVLVALFLHAPNPRAAYAHSPTPTPDSARDNDAVEKGVRGGEEGSRACRVHQTQARASPRQRQLAAAPHRPTSPSPSAPRLPRESVLASTSSPPPLAFTLPPFAFTHPSHASPSTPSAFAPHAASRSRAHPTPPRLRPRHSRHPLLIAVLAGSPKPAAPKCRRNAHLHIDAGGCRVDAEQTRSPHIAHRGRRRARTPAST
ncbi:hypothetical protein PLICRDRAFT_181181 [Plicaturopsis crispa FD-325 SS-3]|uniref:Uncharacterized protein n=1 Tax=Plicaturopsis crispa FD-325 SS-3 TaxID=944288 RepID=A0A0C9T3K3_PLICR|nr:hypothetical protein PLICRDRAFT_181181 [Plicaturopsis crispa FD-325 SS-3]